MLKKFTILTVIILSFIYFSYKLTAVKNVSVNNAGECANEEEIIQKSSLMSKNLILIEENNAKQNILENFPCVTSAEIKKIFPSTVVINLELTRTIAALADTPFTITQDGLVVKAKDSQKLPKLFLPPDVNPQENQKIDDVRVRFALELLKGLIKSDFTPTQVRFTDNIDVVVYSQAEATALFSTTGDASVQVDSLQSVLATARIDSSKISQIDLRFNKPVVTYTK